MAALLRRSHAACMLPPCALPHERLARKPHGRGIVLAALLPPVTARLGAHVRASRTRSGALGVPAERSRGVRGVGPKRSRCFVGHMPPGCSLFPPCQTNASPGNRTGEGSSWRSCFPGHSPPRRARARLADAEWGSRGPPRSVRVGCGTQPRLRGPVRGSRCPLPPLDGTGAPEQSPHARVWWTGTRLAATVLIRGSWPKGPAQSLVLPSDDASVGKNTVK